MLIRYLTLFALFYIISARYLIFQYYDDSGCAKLKQTGYAEVSKCYSETFDDYFSNNQTNFEWRRYASVGKCSSRYTTLTGPIGSCTSQPWGMPIRVIASMNPPPLQGQAVAQLFASRDSCKQGNSGRYNLFSAYFCTPGPNQRESVMVQKDRGAFTLRTYASDNCTGNALLTTVARSGECIPHPLFPGAFVSFTNH